MTSAARQLPFQPMTSDNRLNPVTPVPQSHGPLPLHWSDEAQAWWATRHADVTSGFRDARLGVTPGARLLECDPGVPGVEEAWDRLLLRRRMAAGLTPQALDPWQRSLRHLTQRLVARVWDAGGADGVEALTRPLPALALAELLGIPPHERPHFLDEARALADLPSAGAGPDEAALTRRAQTAAVRLLECLGRTLETRRHVPGEDLLSRLIHGSGEPHLDPARWVPHAVLRLMVEHGACANQLAQGLHELLVQPERFQALRHERARVRSAVEELLRFRPAVPCVHRVVREGFTWQGRVLRKGDAVLLDVATANRDPEVIADPERFELTRDPYTQKHLSFGFGAHHQLSASLVRRELEVFLEVLLEQLPSLRLDAQRPARSKSQGLGSRGFESLPLRW